MELRGVLKFGQFELDLDRYELRRSDQPVRLERLPMELLILLAEGHGGLVTRQEIIGRLWGDNVNVDTELGVNQAIFKLRHALRDNADRPKFVERVAGKGYRFAAPVETVTSNGTALQHDLQVAAAGERSGRERLSAPAVTPTPERGKAKPGRRPWLWLSAAIVAAATIFALAVSLCQKPPAHLPLALTQLTFNSPLLPVTSGYLSPDGAFLAYANRSGVYVRGISSGMVRRLNSPASDTRIAIRGWLSDGTAVLATTQPADPAPWSLWQIPVVAGGKPEMLRQNVNWAAASPNGTEIALTPGDGTSIGLMAADGPNPRILAPPAPGITYAFLTWDAGSSRLECARQRHANFTSSIETIDVTTGNTTTIPSPGYISGLAVLPRGRTIYSVLKPPDEESSNLWSVQIDPLTGKPRLRPRQITDWRGFAFDNLNSSADGKRLAFTRILGNFS